MRDLAYAEIDFVTGAGWGDAVAIGSAVGGGIGADVGIATGVGATAGAAAGVIIGGAAVGSFALGWTAGSWIYDTLDTQILDGLDAILG